MTPAIRCSSLTKRYPGTPPVEAVRHLDLTVEAGTCFGLLGPNGAGKTTTIEILEGLAEPTAGEVEILGHRWADRADDIQQRIGISLQETRLSDKLTVIETLTLFRSFYRRGIPPVEAIRLVALGEKTNARLDKLSGGQRQRLAIACALVGDPELLFLDEPTTGLDPQSRRQLWDVIRDFRARGRTVLLTTHYLDEAEKLCDEVAVIDRGTVIARGSPRRLIDDLGAAHVIDVTLDRPANGTPHLPPDALAGLPSVQSVRPEADGYSLTVREPHLTLPALLDRLKQLGRGLARLSTRHATLEDVFLALTGRHLRDGDASS